MNKKILKIIVECLWLAMAVFCFSAAIYYQIRVGITNVWLFYAMGIISVGMFIMRFMQRKNEEKRNRRRNGN